MLFNTCFLIFIINTCFYTIYALPYARHRRQSKSIISRDLPYEGWAGGSNNPSGAIPGAYYGSGHNPNYGSFHSISNSPDTGMHVLNYYNHNAGTGIVAGIHQTGNSPYQLQQPQSFLNINNNNKWQDINSNMNNYYNRPYNRYPPGSQGWYATGGNYWYSKGQSLAPYKFALVLSVLSSIIHLY